jgi:hypothetical protein
VGPWESKKVDYGFWYSFWIPSVRRNIDLIPNMELQGKKLLDSKTESELIPHMMNTKENRKPGADHNRTAHTA